MIWTARTGLSIAVGVAMALAAPAAFAQDTTSTPTQPPPAVEGEGAIPPPKVVTTVQAPMAAPAAPRAREEEDPISDHEKVIGHVGVGYLGVSDLPISAGGNGVPNRGSVSAPVIGVRYWMAEKVGLDLGVGFGLTSGSTEVAPAGASAIQTDLGSRFGLAVHGGVPLVLAHQKHFKFLLIPELNVGFTNQSNETGTGPATVKTTLSGFRLDLGARIGGEIHFGFIGVPQLALQATVGAFVKREAWKTTAEVNGNSSSASQGATAFGTSVQSDPWALFTNNISAIYYLP
jgi:hypothetical protein